MSAHLFAEGHAVAAHYHIPAVAEHRENPFIEALPPTLSREAARAAMAWLPEYDDASRRAADIDREHMASMLSAIRKPVGVHIELHSRLSRLIRTGYVARNPMQPFFQRHIDARQDALAVTGTAKDILVTGAYRLGAGPRPCSTGLTFLGLSGIGKSAAIDMCLRLYPQMIVHSTYKQQPFSRTQITWLKLDVPPDGSILGLAERFFTAVDSLHEALDVPTQYRKEYLTGKTTVQRVIPRMARLAAQHGLGVLVLDEIQDLNPRGSRAILSFLVQLVNTVGIPVVLVGGIDALPILNEQFRQARRGASEGDLIVQRAERGKGWRDFCETLWTYQYTAHASPLTDECAEALYEVSQGITQYVVLAYKLAQIRAISTGIERVTPDVIASVRDSLSQAAPVLDAIRRGNVEVLRRLGDVALPEGISGIPFLRGDAVPDAVSSSPTGSVRGADVAPARTSRAELVKSETAPTQTVAPEPGRSKIGWRVRRPSDEARALDSGRTKESGLGQSLVDIAAAAVKSDVPVADALREHGVMGDALWTRIIDAAGGAE